MPESSAPPVRMALIGGGAGAFIAPVHRMAAELDRRIELISGVFSRDRARNFAAAHDWGVDQGRTYNDLGALLAAETRRPDGVELVVVATPNASHFELSKAALEAGLHVVSDKPATATLEEAFALERIAANAPGLYALTFTYTGYPMIRKARALVREGAIGRVRKVAVNYTQGWLWRAVEGKANRQADWRTDPAQAGQGGAIADIGSHAFNLAEYVSGLSIERLCADLATMVPARAVDDDGMVLCQFSDGARGLLHVSQVASGAQNDLVIEIWGDEGGVRWAHTSSEQLLMRRPGAPDQLWHAGEPYSGSGTPRLPTGHPQGFIEAFANIYGDIAHAIRSGKPAPDIQGIEAGVRAMRFIDRALASSRERRWLELAA